jgi:hypothetical protein
MPSEVIKWKARINVDQSKEQAGIEYGETFAPEASWLLRSIYDGNK